MESNKIKIELRLTKAEYKKLKRVMKKEEIIYEELFIKYILSKNDCI